MPLRPGLTLDSDERPRKGPSARPLRVSSDGAGGGLLVAEIDIRPDLLAPNGFLHAATVVALADTACGYGCIAHLPDGAENFTTVELKCNFLGTAREGTIACTASAAHLGRTTQVWDATVARQSDGKPIALFRCTQMILWPKSA